jgi:hypothetical protein
MAELTIIFIVVAFIAWVAWTAQKSKQALDKEFLDEAWREVLDDPHYMERRHYEERKRVEDYDHRYAQKLISLDTSNQRNPGNFPGFCRWVGSQIAHNVRFTPKSGH